MVYQASQETPEIIKSKGGADVTIGSKHRFKLAER